MNRGQSRPICQDHDDFVPRHYMYAVGTVTEGATAYHWLLGPGCVDRGWKGKSLAMTEERRSDADS
jgi:hypothetical protein